MAQESPSGSFVHSALYAQLMIQVSGQLFPEQTFFALSADQRRIVQAETSNLLLQARWQVDSKAFADLFAVAQAGGQEAPPGTILGRANSSPSASPPAKGGDYI